MKKELRTRDEIERKLKSKQEELKNQEDSGTVNECLTREIALLQWTLENEDSRRSGMQVK